MPRAVKSGSGPSLCTLSLLKLRLLLLCCLSLISSCRSCQAWPFLALLVTSLMPWKGGGQQGPLLQVVHLHLPGRHPLSCPLLPFHISRSALLEAASSFCGGCTHSQGTGSDEEKSFVVKAECSVSPPLGGLPSTPSLPLCHICPFISPAASTLT